MEDLAQEGRAYTLTQDDIARINPNTSNLPIVRSKKDASLIKAIYARVPILLREVGVESNPWTLSFSAMFHMTNDAGLFRTRGEMREGGWNLDGNSFRQGTKRLFPLYEAKLAGMFNHRAATFEGIAESDMYGTRAGTNKPSLVQLGNPVWTYLPRYWVSEEDVARKVPGFWRRGWLIGFRNAISAVADARTVTFTVFPICGVGNSLPLLFPEGSEASPGLLVANFNSFVLDYVAKQKASGGNLNFYKGGIYLTQVAPTCSMAGCGGVSPESGRFRGSVRHRASVSGLPVPAAMAGGLPVPVLWRPSFLARAIRAHAVPSVWSPNVGDGGHDLPGHA